MYEGWRLKLTCLSLNMACCVLAGPRRSVFHGNARAPQEGEWANQAAHKGHSSLGQDPDARMGQLQGVPGHAHHWHHWPKRHPMVRSAPCQHSQGRLRCETQWARVCRCRLTSDVCMCSSPVIVIATMHVHRLNLVCASVWPSQPQPPFCVLHPDLQCSDSWAALPPTSCTCLPLLAPYTPMCCLCLCRAEMVGLPCPPQAGLNRLQLLRRRQPDAMNAVLAGLKVQMGGREGRGAQMHEDGGRTEGLVTQRHGCMAWAWVLVLEVIDETV